MFDGDELIDLQVSLSKVIITGDVLVNMNRSIVD